MSYYPISQVHLAVLIFPMISLHPHHITISSNGEKWTSSPFKSVMEPYLILDNSLSK